MREYVTPEIFAEISMQIQERGSTPQKTEVVTLNADMLDVVTEDDKVVASVSFWEGVDVRGDALSLVVIDKLPFAPPDDPVLAARIEKLRAEGRNPFMEYQLPRAVISMKQGAGRLIRDETDRGVLMICDPRMLGKPYGRRVWQSLPPMRRTREVSDVVDFFAVKSAHEHD